MYFPSFFAQPHWNEHLYGEIALNRRYTSIPEQEQLAPSVARVPLLSFFTGAGFLDLGFLLAGFDIIWRNESNPWFIQGFEHAMSNIMGMTDNGKIHNTSSILALEPAQIARQAFHGIPRPEVFGMIGGPPCPDFCNGGKHRGRTGDHGMLSQVYIDAICELQPTFFLFENVPGLLHMKKHRQFLVEIINQLLPDYILALGVLNALEYGVPQNRERLFLVGFQRTWSKKHLSLHVPVKRTFWDSPTLSVQEKDYFPFATDISSWFPWPIDSRYLSAKTRFAWPTLSPFGANPEKPAGIPDTLMIGSAIPSIEALGTLPNGFEGFHPMSNKFVLIAEGDVSGKSFKRLHRWRYSPAAAYGHNEVHLHPTEPRRLTVREALRIQSVPDSYIFPADLPLSHKFKMIGNGVPMKLAHALAITFATLLCESGFRSL